MDHGQNWLNGCDRTEQFSQLGGTPARVGCQPRPGLRPPSPVLWGQFCFANLPSFHLRAFVLGFMITYFFPQISIRCDYYDFFIPQDMINQRSLFHERTDYERTVLI